MSQRNGKLVRQFSDLAGFINVRRDKRTFAALPQKRKAALRHDMQRRVRLARDGYVQVVDEEVS